MNKPIAINRAVKGKPFPHIFAGMNLVNKKSYTFYQVKKMSVDFINTIEPMDLYPLNTSLKYKTISKVKLKDLNSGKQVRNVVLTRQLCTYIIKNIDIDCCKITNISNTSYPSLAREFKLKSHATVMMGNRHIEDIISVDRVIGGRIKEFVKQFSIIN